MSVTSIDASSSHILDNPAWAALTGPHARFAERVGHAVRYQQDVAPFHALSDEDDPRAWVDLAALVGPGGTAAVRGVTEAAVGWEVVRTGHGVQLVDTALRAEPDPEAVRLGPGDVPEILDLVARGERPFLHAAATNVNAIRLYESIGFTLRRRTAFSLVRRTGAAALEETA
ncbi:GNAT family N-acetyltransferase [Streptomyces anandii]|uniref:GNAT family N-acetyltransferase n=1 Tax=Streptomyces anandii TaxID=285454 RepID=UPI0037903C6C